MLDSTCRKKQIDCYLEILKIKNRIFLGIHVLTKLSQVLFSVVDQYCLDTDPDSTFHFDADPDPDPITNFTQRQLKCFNLPRQNVS